MRLFFGKSEKLTSEKEIDQLFLKGRSSFLYPIKSIYLINEEEATGSRVLITVSKKNLKNASDRNLVKRRLREAYRINSHQLKETLTEKNLNISLAFIYSSSKIISFDKIETLVIKHLSNLTAIIEKRE
ncbi:MAG: ribonuclease P protein component [Bacteroidales bacterium]|nr:MAG: ribonuclease P protein component [Bacteroidales bacterium]